MDNSIRRIITDIIDTALNNASGVSVVWVNGRLQRMVERRKTATSGNIAYQCLYENLMNDGVFPYWDDGDVLLYGKGYSRITVGAPTS